MSLLWAWKREPKPREMAISIISFVLPQIDLKNKTASDKSATWKTDLGRSSAIPTLVRKHSASWRHQGELEVPDWLLITEVGRRGSAQSDSFLLNNPTSANRSFVWVTCGYFPIMFLNSNDTDVRMQFMGTEGGGILIQTYLQMHLYKYLTLYSWCYGDNGGSGILGNHIFEGLVINEQNDGLFKCLYVVDKIMEDSLALTRRICYYMKGID